MGLENKHITAKVILAAMILTVIVLEWPHKSGMIVGQYRDLVIASLNKELASPDNQIRRQIEHAHVTVTAKSATVTSCAVGTIDGTDNAGKNGKNVAEVDVIITVIWDGWIDKNGFTEVEVDYDMQNRIVKQSKYLRSSAMINVDTVDWTAVGYAIGEYVAAASM